MRIVFRDGKKCDEEGNVRTIIQTLKQKQEYLHSIHIDAILDFFDTAATELSRNKEVEKKVGSVLRQTFKFMEKKSTAAMLDFALRGDYHILDKFIDRNQGKYMYHCQPRGLAVHWLAGNVPLLGMYSIIQALLTKNVSLVKAASGAHDELTSLLELLAKVNTKEVDGRELRSTIAVILVDRNDGENLTIISEAADIRIAWGGHEAIETITRLKKSIFCEDIIFGPKYSYAVIDKEALEDYKILTRRLAFDVCTFDQYACSSPHTVFVQESAKTTVEAFAQELAQQIELVTQKMLPKAEEESGKKMDILGTRAKYSMLGKVYASKGTEWTVIVTKEPGLAQACFSRVIYVKAIKEIWELKKYNDKQKQTLGCALKNPEREKIIDDITVHGIDRCPEWGDMTLYESPWDGMFPVDRMVRWISLRKK